MLRPRAADALAAAALGAWALIWFHTWARGGGMAWHYFRTGDAELADLRDSVDGGLHLYAAMPYLQIGPVALATSLLLQHLTPDGGLVAVQLLGVAAGVAILWLVRSVAGIAQPLRPARVVNRQLALATAFFTPVWMYAAVRSTHLDDVLALLFGVIAVRLVLDGRAVLAGAALGLAIDAKPWALPFACLLLVLPTVRDRAAGTISATAFVLAAWLPFVLGDPRTAARLDRFTIKNQATSVLRLLGVDTARTPPWDRPTQAALGIALALLAIRRGRWEATILLVVAARIVLDPGVNRYYLAGLAVGAVLWDVAGSRRRFPYWTSSMALALFASRWRHLPTDVHSSLTLTFCLLVMVLLALRPANGLRRPAGTVAMSTGDEGGGPRDRAAEHARSPGRGGPGEEGGG
jgi:hypothetical protein